MEGKIKAPPSGGRIWLVGLEFFGIQTTQSAGASAGNTNVFNAPRAIQKISERAQRNDDPRR
jgi:hypothetical protein